jgi:hypothetical protein
MILRIKFSVLSFVTISEQARHRVLPSEFATWRSHCGIPSVAGSGSECGTLFVFRNKDYGKLQNRRFGLPIRVSGTPIAERL